MTRNRARKGALIRSFRKQAKLKRSELANKMGLSLKQLSLKERGKLRFHAGEFSLAYALIFQALCKSQDEQLDELGMGCNPRRHRLSGRG